MHDVDRKSIFYRDWDKKKSRDHEHIDCGDEHGPQHGQLPHGHDHPHDEPPHEHDHHGDGSRLDPADHDHRHPESAYEKHYRDSHDHHHHAEGRSSRDRVFTHLHGHNHVFYHAHHHEHDPNRRSLLHKIFKDPVRDWFGVGIIVLMITIGQFGWLPGVLSDGILVCAAVIGIFPAFKNAVVSAILKRKPTFELVITVLLIAGLFTGRYLEIALCSLLLLMGSFLRLDFSWKIH
jgi:cation transport ATPase